MSCSNNIFGFDVKILQGLNYRVIFIDIGNMTINFVSY